MKFNTRTQHVARTKCCYAIIYLYDGGNPLVPGIKILDGGNPTQGGAKLLDGGNP